MSEVIGGSCLCKGVQFSIRGPYTAFRYCHCGRCRKASGSAHAANLFVPESQFAWTSGDDKVRRYDVPSAERFSVWFCSDCGSRVPHKVRSRTDMLIPAGLLDADPGMRPENGIFWGSRAPWYLEPAQMPCLSEYQ